MYLVSYNIHFAHISYNIIILLSRSYYISSINKIPFFFFVPIKNMYNIQYKIKFQLVYTNVAYYNNYNNIKNNLPALQLFDALFNTFF